jgi:hypothetical protein
VQVLSATGCGPVSPRSVQDLATGEILSICRVDGPDDCRFDTAKLAEAAQRFGKEEARGGLCAELARAAEREHPTLTAGRRGLVHNWHSFTGGVGTLLDAPLGALGLVEGCRPRSW